MYGLNISQFDHRHFGVLSLKTTAQLAQQSANSGYFQRLIKRNMPGLVAIAQHECGELGHDVAIPAAKVAHEHLIKNFDTYVKETLEKRCAVRPLIGIVVAAEATRRAEQAIKKQVKALLPTRRSETTSL